MQPLTAVLHAVRRKFLRQNRDIAKINSDQSQKIRRLENDCARLLSENLDLRGQILRLEKQAEDNSAQRVADHALEVKAKLEVQLSEFAALLGSLGVEPPSKRRSSGDRILAKPRQNMARSPPYRRRRDTAVDAEMLAEQEGRLAPIYENKTYPRATMNSEEIMALCAAAEDTTNSPDLGPPPVSRFVEEDPVKHSPGRETEEFVPESPRQPPPTLLSPPKLDYNRTIPKSPEPTKEPDESVVKQASPIKKAVPVTTPTPEPASQPTRTGAKRKYGDENGTMQSVTVQAGKENAAVTEKTFPTRAGQKRRSLAEQAGNKPDRKTARTPLGAKRTPLAAKSTNEDVSSPRKTTKAAPKESKKEHARGPTESVMTDVSDAPKPPTEIMVFPEPPPPEVVHLLESATALPSAAPSSPTPTTPDRSAPKDMLHDTPPPADISSTGETIRPSRRARPAISYAEPNLRDKMRRPSKQLFDAVTGEGKFAHRASSHKSDDLPSGPTSSSKARSEMGSSAGGSSKTITVCDTATKAQQQALLSPLAQKDAFQETLPSTVTMERRRRPSAVGSRESLAASERPESTSREASPTVTAAPQEANQLSSRPKPTTSSDKKPAPLAQKKADIYDFTASSPVPTSKAPTPDTSAESHPSTSSTMSSSNPPRARTTRKSSIAAAAALRHMLDDEDEHDSTKHNPPPAASKSRAAHAGRKRASMLAPKKSSMVDVLEEAALDADTSGSSLEGDGPSAGAGAGGRVSRRRSMML
jgi:hypothetical protein